MPLWEDRPSYLMTLGEHSIDVDQLGRVERVDARLVWGHEALDFTPWLEEHIDELAERIGVELQIEAREVAVGPFSADLLGRDVTTGARLLIENQLAPTNHGHLGQIVTYAAGLDTRVMVWVAPQIREEHRQAIDWLNQVTREEYNFFAVRIELLRIGERYAPDFVIVASPNAWQRRIRNVADRAEPSAGRDERWRDIWARFIEKLRAKDSTAAHARTGPNRAVFGTPGGFLVWFSQQGPRAECYLDYGSRDRTKAIFDALFRKRHEIEEAVGHALSWERRDDGQASRIALYTQGSADLDGTELDALLDRLVDNLLLLRRGLPPFVRDAERETETEEAEPGETAIDPDSSFGVPPQVDDAGGSG